MGSNRPTTRRFSAPRSIEQQRLPRSPNSLQQSYRTFTSLDYR